MKRLAAVFAVLSLTLAAVPAAMGDFSTPPETNGDIAWVTAAPYQRNMTLDFSQDPVDPTGGTGAIPGAKYIGYDDPSLWESDWVELNGLTWDADLGAVGIFNGEYGDGGSIIVHFDNWERQWPVKHLYAEFTFVLAAPEITLDWGVNAPPGYSYSYADAWYASFGDNPYTIQYYQPIEPNPPWEELYIGLVLAAPYGSVYITDLQIATECVPVPGATLLGLLGLGAAGVKLRRFV